MGKKLEKQNAYMESVRELLELIKEVMEVAEDVGIKLTVAQAQGVIKQADVDGKFGV